MAARTAIVAFSTEITPSLVGTFGRNEYGLVGDAEERSELAFQRRPKTNRSLDGDNDGLDLDARTFFAARTIALRGAFLTRLPARAVFIARAVALRDSFLARFAARTIFETRTIALRGTLLTGLAARAVFITRAITLRDSFLTGLATRTIFNLRTVSGGSALLRLTRLAWFALFTRLARLRGLLC
jgi:hypothetical protein